MFQLRPGLPLVERTIHSSSPYGVKMAIVLQSHFLRLSNQPLQFSNPRRSLSLSPLFVFFCFLLPPLLHTNLLFETALN